MATTVTIYANQDGHLYAKTADHWSNARDAASANVKDTTSETMRVGLAYISPPDPGDAYRFYRLYLYFDTSAIPADAVVTGAAVSLYLAGLLSIISGGFDVVLMNGQDTYPSGTLSTGDFDRTHYSGGGCTPKTIIDGASGYQIISLNATGRADWINKGGTTKLCIMSSLDVTPTVPQLYMLADFYTAEETEIGERRPKLDITYGLAATVTTQAASSINTTSATGNGNITSIGDDPVTAHGACWKEGSDPVNLAGADDSVDDGAAGTGAFTSSMTSLTASTLYYYRAYATNAQGTSYGTVQSFYSDGIATLTTEAASSIGETTATGNGTIIAEGGESITAHGMVYAADGDPGQPSDPTTVLYTDEGAGSAGAFTSSITALNPGTLYYCRAYATNSHGTGYGDAVSFNTTDPTQVPEVSTTSIAYTSGTTATVSGSIDDIGGDSITAHGAIYRHGGDPLGNPDGTSDEGAAGGAGAFTSDITPAYSYVHYVRAYATNSFGTGYGDIVAFRINTQLVTTTTSIEESDGRLDYVSAVSYAACRTNSTASAISDTAIVFIVGQLHTGPPNLWHIYRSYLYWDTSSIPTSATIVSAKVYLSVQAGTIQEDFDLVLQNGQATYPHDPLVVGDYDQSNYSSGNSSTNATALAGAGSGYITLDSGDLGWITKGGTTKLCLRSSDDIDGNAPGDNKASHITFFSHDEAVAGRHPRLTVEYLDVKNLVKTNIAGTWMWGEAMQINIGDAWKDVTEVKINIGDAWKDLTE